MMNERRIGYLVKNRKRVSVKESKGEWQGSEYNKVEYEDGSSDADLGGPCGSIYTDRDGNM